MLASAASPSRSHRCRTYRWHLDARRSKHRRQHRAFGIVEPSSVTCGCRRPARGVGWPVGRMITDVTSRSWAPGA